METDRHYFIVGLFIIGLSCVAALFSAWLTGAGHRGRCALPNPLRRVRERARAG
jgi:ABC-type transporter Mla subunit MlaD